MKTCFGYTRVSTAKQGEGVSLEAQKEAILGFASRNNIEIIQWYEEKETAAKKGRPIFNQMIAALKHRKADGLVVHKIDRSARNFADWAKIGDLADAGIGIHFATESLDFNSRGGRLTADIQAVIAADYIRNLREECIKGIYGRLKQGIYPFNAPIGYINNGGGKAKTPDPIRAPLVQEIFKRYETGEYSIRSLCEVAKEIGLRTQRGNLLTKTNIEIILNNSFYCGIIRINKTGQLFDGIHETLISPKSFERVQDIKSGRYRKKITKHIHTYRGLFRCALCDTAMIPERQKGNVYYRCHTSKCPTKTVREYMLEGEVLGMLSNIKISNQDFDQMATAMNEWFDQRDNSDSMKKAAALQIAQINDRMERLTDALIDRLIDQSTFNARKRSLMLEKLEIEQNLENLDNIASERENVFKFLELIKNLTSTYEIANEAEKRQIVEFASSNRLVDGKKVSLEPSDALLASQSLAGVLCGGPQRDTSRTFSQKLASQMKELVKLSKSKAILKMRKQLFGEFELINRQGHNWRDNFGNN